MTTTTVRPSTTQPPPHTTEPPSTTPPTTPGTGPGSPATGSLNADIAVTGPDVGQLGGALHPASFQASWNWKAPHDFYVTSVSYQLLIGGTQGYTQSCSQAAPGAYCVASPVGNALVDAQYQAPQYCSSGATCPALQPAQETVYYLSATQPGQYSTVQVTGAQVTGYVLKTTPSKAPPTCTTVRVEVRANQWKNEISCSPRPSKQKKVYEHFTSFTYSYNGQALASYTGANGGYSAPKDLVVVGTTDVQGP